MEKPKKSGSAIFMYCVIALTLVVSAVAFVLHYSGTYENTVLLWTGIVAFMIMYHFWVRIIMGNISKLFTIHYNQVWFCELPFEKKFYKLLRVKKWKDKALTYNPQDFSFENRTPVEIANTMAKSEVDHWINEIISITSMFFAILWGEAWIFILSAIAAMIFDAQFIVIQRYNRPRVVRLIKKQEKAYNL